MAVNPGAADAKPKVQVAKKANILAQLPNTEVQPVRQVARSNEADRHEPRQQQHKPQVDQDMGIVMQSRTVRERSPPQQAISPNPMIPKQQVILKSSQTNEGPQTSGQRRAAAELDRIRREQTRSTGEPNTSNAVDPSLRRSSNTSTANNEDELEKIKSVLRQHERRIRMLEDQLADANMASAYGL